MTSRRNVFVRTIATVAGDLAVGFAVASACTWIIQVAALGLFLSFLLWLLSLVAYLAFSQYVLHPAVAVVLSDRKLDGGIAVSAEAVRAAAGIATQLWGWAQQRGFPHRGTAA